MNDTHKLLLAFIEASGFDVEEEYKVYISGVYIRTQKHKYPKDINNMFPVHNETDYKVTKKEAEAMVTLPVQSEAWGCVVEFVSKHAEIIQSSSGDIGELKPMLDFMNRNC